MCLSLATSHRVLISWVGLVALCTVHACNAVILCTNPIPMCSTIGVVGVERTLANVLYLWMILVPFLLVLIPSLLLLLLLWALHLLAPCLESACLILNNWIEAHVSSYSAAPPLLKTTYIFLMITSLLLVLLPTIGRLSLCTVVWRIYVTRLFGVIFRLFQSCPYDYQANGARVRATGIVGILTGFFMCFFCVKSQFRKSPGSTTTTVMSSCNSSDAYRSWGV